MPSMSPKQFKTLREGMGMSKPMMAAHMRIPNPEANGRNAINRIESGNHSLGIPGPIAVAAEAIASGFRATCGSCGLKADDRIVTACMRTDCPFPCDE